MQNTTPDFSDSATGSTLAGTFFENGANIVFADCGMVGDGITSKAKETKKLAIQVELNLDDTQPGYVLTSVLKTQAYRLRPLPAHMQTEPIKDMDNLQSYNLESGATGITDMSVLRDHVEDQALFDELVQKVNDVAEQIKSGEIVVTNAQNGETLDTAAVTHVNIK